MKFKDIRKKYVLRDKKSNLYVSFNDESIDMDYNYVDYRFVDNIFDAKKIQCSYSLMGSYLKVILSMCKINKYDVDIVIDEIECTTIINNPNHIRENGLGANFKD